ncbi:MAG: hypothetical protein ABSD31_09210 [Candidatus Binataceae bacterium]|jgi:hypothetical protein
MLDPQTYRTHEQIAKSLTPSWRISQVHNLDHFERTGFPVRLSTIRELGQIIDTMQENRFAPYMQELRGLSSSEFKLILESCKDAVVFQLTYLPHRPPVLPISTLLSMFALYNKIQGAKPGFRSVLEIGPGCGYLSFFLRHHRPLANYSQIEACESFYILQNWVNLFSFGHRHDERVLASLAANDVAYFAKAHSHLEFSPTLRTQSISPLCTHYPWWRFREIIDREITFDVVTSNANLLEFSAQALDDYLEVIRFCLKTNGVFVVQCTGLDVNGTEEQLLEKLHRAGFAPLIFAIQSTPIKLNTAANHLRSLDSLRTGEHDSISFVTNNAAFVKRGHQLFQKYCDHKNFQRNFVASEQIVKSMYFSRPPERQMYEIGDFIEATEAALSNQSMDRQYLSDEA